MSDLIQANFLDQAAPGVRKGERTIPPGAAIERCKSCGAEIIWARTDEGRPIPLSVATAQIRDKVTWLLPHFVDCPEAKEWSRKGRR